MIARYAIFFFFAMGVVVIPLVCALLCRWWLPRRLWRRAALLVTLLVWAVVFYGHLVGFEQLQVRRCEFASSSLPPSFDGYRIVHISDAHVGTMTGRRQWMLERAVDSINALRPDLIVFTGDLQNVWPDELDSQLPLLRQLRARDGVVSVLGNHDYAVYQTGDSLAKAANCRRTIDAERRAGWQLLLNEYRIVRRGSDSIVVAGMENWSSVRRLPRRGDVARTLSTPRPFASAGSGTPSAVGAPFVVMLQHDPTCWREHILFESNAQLTLSGHTHGGQLSLLGLSPAALAYREYAGWYYEGPRALHVSTGLGSLIPFRLGMPGEIVEITLRRQIVDH